MQCKATLGRANRMFGGASAGCQTEASARWSDSTLTCATPALTRVAARDRLARTRDLVQVSSGNVLAGLTFHGRHFRLSARFRLTWNSVKTGWPDSCYDDRAGLFDDLLSAIFSLCFRFFFGIHADAGPGLGSFR